MNSRGSACLITLVCFASIASLAESAPPAPPAHSTSNAPPIQQISEHVFQVGEVRLDKNARTLTFPAVLNMNAGLLEFLCDAGGTKLHESLLRTEISPFHLHLAALLLSRPGEAKEANGARAVAVALSWTQNGENISSPAEELVLKHNPKTNIKEPWKSGRWSYTGWAGNKLPAEPSGVLIALIDESTALINSSDPDRSNDEIWFANSSLAPSPGTPVKIEIKFLNPKSDAVGN